MLDLGFYSAIKGIASSLPIRRQTMLFSATMPAETSTRAKFCVILSASKLHNPA